MIELLNMECMEYMQKMESSSVDAIITDPPYFRVKGEAWDNQWDTAENFLEWVGNLCIEFKRIMKPNGSMYFFASPQMAARVECEIGASFNVLNSITWRKGAAGKAAVGWLQKTEKEALRSWLPETERIIFAEQKAANEALTFAEYELNGHVFEPLKNWFRGCAKKAGIGNHEFNSALGFATNGGGVASGVIGEKIQFTMPTEEVYAKMRAAFPVFDREYEELRREYEELRREYEELRRPFAVTSRDQWSDVWEFDPVQAYPGKHPCEKPIPLLCHILKASTKPNSIVFDPFAGSASLAEACHLLGRHFIGTELCPDNYAKAIRRIKAVTAQERLFA
jgi:adenine-specific DNA-methyltransferase